MTMKVKPIAKSKYVPQKCGMPSGPMINRPSIEYTGRGNVLCKLAWNARLFRSDPEDVMKQCGAVAKLVNGTDEEDGEPVNLNAINQRLGIVPADADEFRGWSPDDTTAFPCFVYDWLGPGTEDYERFGEKVFLVSIPVEATPIERYWD